MKCYKCGAEVDSESKFCSMCGSSQGFSEKLLADAQQGKQDAYIRGFQHLEQLDEPNHFRAWIKRIGINTAKNYLKKKQPILFQRWKVQKMMTARNYNLLTRDRRIYQRSPLTKRKQQGLSMKS